MFRLQSGIDFQLTQRASREEYFWLDVPLVKILHSYSRPHQDGELNYIWEGGNYAFTESEFGCSYFVAEILLRIVDVLRLLV